MNKLWEIRWIRKLIISLSLMLLVILVSLTMVLLINYDGVISYFIASMLLAGAIAIMISSHRFNWFEKEGKQ
ncbi:MAG: hypothetical protein ACQEXQ_16300 [Bacillota bacterium]